MRQIFCITCYQLIDKFQGLFKLFGNNSMADIILLKNQLSKMVALGRSLGRLFNPLTRVDLPLIKTMLAPLAKSVLMPLGLTAAISATNVAIQKRMFG